MQNQASLKIMIMVVNGGGKSLLSLFHLFTSHKVTAVLLQSCKDGHLLPVLLQTPPHGDFTVKFYNVALETDTLVFILNQATA